MKTKASPITPGVTAISLGETRTVAEPLVAAQLIGKIRLVSDQGAAVLSNNSAGVLSNNGGGLISDQSGSLIGKIRYALAQAPAPTSAPESLLAEAVVEVLDAEGRLLVDGAGKPITATSDATGSYRLDARLPAGNLVLRVRLFPTAQAPASGGQLQAILPVGAGARTVDIDTASSLGAGYVLDRYVRNRQAIYDRLPATEAEALQRDMQAARSLLDAVPTYRPAELVDLAEKLREKAPALDQTLERIKAILVAGQSELGDGQMATTVALSNPFGVLADVRTTPPTLYVGETGRIRRITPEGFIQRFAGGLTTSFAAEGDPLAVSLDAPGNLAIAPDGTLYACDYVTNKVYRIRDGQLSIVAGTGARLQGAVGGLARETAVRGPSTVVVADDGRIYFGEFPKTADVDGRILYIEPDGRLGEVPGPFGGRGAGLITGLAIAKDGTIYVLDSGNEKDSALWRRDPASGAWTKMLGTLPVTDTSRLAMGPDGALYMSQGQKHQIVRVSADGITTVVAGKGEPGDGGDGGPSSAAGLNEPSAFWFAPDGTLYIADFGNGLIRRVKGGTDGRGIIETVAGSRAATQQGDALAITLNTPTALAVDAAGGLVVAEGIGGTIKRLEGSALKLVAGAGRGFSGDGGPVLAARFDTPTGIAFDGDAWYVLDAGNHRIRQVAADGTVSTVLGGGAGSLRVQNVARLPAAVAPCSAPFGAAMSPAGELYWCDNKGHQVLRLTRDGFVEVVAGGLDGKPGDVGDGGPAAEARLNTPTALTFDRRGNLFVADTANGRVRRIAPNGQIDTVAGMPFGQVMADLLSSMPEPSGEADARAGWLLAPVALGTDAANNLYVAELGSARIATLVGALGISMNLDDLPRHGSRVRKVTGLDTPTPRMVTIAGEGGPLLGGPSTDNGLLVPLGLVIDQQGRLIIADSGSNQLKLLPAGSF